MGEQQSNSENDQINVAAWLYGDAYRFIVGWTYDKSRTPDCNSQPHETDRQLCGWMVVCWSYGLITV